ncbi:unnamed protein product [Hyaloperonospora brassicae]|uniref:RxLR effector candidate protein n=1 Tax=Hyaloperonospora brassicae TaxID=162125 RepID=A0AAV0T9S8_HYABA|nr:unnamed protein product [Hyaloperonospora brassicae]
MLELLLVALGVTASALVTLWLLRTFNRVAHNVSKASTSTVSSDDDIDISAASPLRVDVSSDHDERGALLPKLVDLLRSPRRKGATTTHPKPVVMMRSVTGPARSVSLTLSLGTATGAKQSHHVPVRRVHVPHFYPLLDETAEWWRTQQCPAEGETCEPVQEEGPDADVVGLEDSSAVMWQHC